MSSRLDRLSCLKQCQELSVLRGCANIRFDAVLISYLLAISERAVNLDGFERIDKDIVYHTWSHDAQLGDGFAIYLPARTAVVLQKVERIKAEKPAAKKTAKKVEKTETREEK